MNIDRRTLLKGTAALATTSAGIAPLLSPASQHPTNHPGIDRQAVQAILDETLASAGVSGAQLSLQLGKRGRTLWQAQLIAIWLSP